MLVEGRLKNEISSPQLAPIPLGADPRLIDSGLLHYGASIAGYAERYRRGETSHTLHVWWARRPHSAMRILTFASLCKELSPSMFEIMNNVSSSPTSNVNIVHRVREIIKNQYPEPPKLLDMFAGGGTIPFEASNIGAQSYSLDSNELSVFIQKCNLVYSQDVDQKRIREIIKKSGMRVLDSLREQTEELFPLRKEYRKHNQQLFDNNDGIPFGYFWTYSTKCPNCNYSYYLTKRPWLSRKKGKRVAIVFGNGAKRQEVHIQEVQDDYQSTSNWLGRNGKAKCPQCDFVTEKIDFKDTQDELVAIAKTKEVGKEFSLPPSDISPIPSVKRLKTLERKLISEIGCELPKSKLPKWSGIVNPAIYGINTHADFLNIRQRLVLLILIKNLLAEYDILKKEESEHTAKYVISILSSFLDQLIDWNCRLSMWISQNEQMGRAFCGPGVSMLWDYVESDPVMYGPANLWSKLNRILAGASSIGKFPHKPIVKHGYAQDLPFENDQFDAIVTDPPYYDNIYYNVLADFFYSWKRILLQKIEPDLFDKEMTDFEHELVASTFRNRTAEAAHETYCRQLQKAIGEAERVLSVNGVFAFIYSHSSLNGWEALLRAFRRTNFLITSVQPLSIERRHRPRGMSSEAVNTCIAFVARKTTLPKDDISIDGVGKKISEICGSYAVVLEKAGWHEDDIALAVFAHGAGYLSNFRHVEGIRNDQEELRYVEAAVREYFSNFRIKSRNSL